MHTIKLKVSKKIYPTIMFFLKSLEYNGLLTIKESKSSKNKNKKLLKELDNLFLEANKKGKK